MLNIEQIKDEIVEKLIPLEPDKIILFGSYAYGTPTEDSDLDIFLVKDELRDEEFDNFEVEAKIKLLDTMRKYKTNGIDIISASSDYLNSRDDYFYKIDILEKGKVLYERNSS
ncbi:MAG: nucleotidyltransferase domain-containing protein [Campylobacterota bacterium]|nr:nucleotidyltransferase domain-containing protein [Campylobacterota bacterium]